MSANGSRDDSRGAGSGEGVEGRTPWQKFRLVVKVVELRLRFIALMALTGLTFAYWDTIWNRYDKWMRPPASAPSATARSVEYYCPMHPNVVREEPGACPICGMPLTKRAKGEKAPLPPGVLARVQLAPLRVAQGGIRTVEVVYSPMTETLTTVGTVEFDERRLAHIASKTRGMARVEKLYVNFGGVDVAEGQTLAELYSPELYQAIQELLLARRSSQDAAHARSTLGRSLLGDPGEMTRLAVEKLKLWGLTQAQVDQILSQGKADVNVSIASPISGHVVKKNIVEGQYVSEGQAMFEIADLRTVWLKAQVYEDQIGLVHVGQQVEAAVDAFPGQVFPGKVAFIQPHLDPATRTIEVRFDLVNPGHKLRPGMFARVTLRTPMAETPMFRAMFANAHPAEANPRRTNLSVEQQKICPVTKAELGTMGPPIAVTVEGEKVWTCCDACPPKLKADPGKYLPKKERKAVVRASLTPQEQKICPVTGAKLGSMGAPIAVEVMGRKVWLCCDACPPKLKASPAKYLAKLEPMAAVAREEQTSCPVSGAKLGSMGTPVAVDVEGRRVLVCCSACPPVLKANPAKYLARLAPPPEDGVLSVPESAVIDTGALQMVYVEAEPGVYEGRRVVLGPRSEDGFAVLDGLAPGERVVAHGAFLVDAESRLNPATRGDPSTMPAAPRVEEHKHDAPTPAPAAAPAHPAGMAPAGKEHVDR